MATNPSKKADQAKTNKTFVEPATPANAPDMTPERRAELQAEHEKREHTQGDQDVIKADQLLAD